MSAQYDIVVRGGHVADGLGSPLFAADVAVADGRIVAVGRVTGRGREEIAADGALVTPGVVDIHTHYDGQAVWDSSLASSSWHGVTTIVMGNCGVGFAPVRPEHRELLIELMEGVEDIPGIALHEGLDWRWESFGEFLDVIARRPHDLDVCAMLPHGPLRVYVMGERAARLEAATPGDIARMRALAADAVRAGAIGFSTSRSINHRTVKGDPTPSLRAAEDELTGIALGLRDAGGGVLQLLSDFDPPALEREFAMLCRVARESGRPMSFGLIQQHDAPDKWRSLLAMLDAAAKTGLELRAQVAPRAIGVLMGLQATLNPFSRTPTYAAVADLPLEQRVAVMRDPAFKARLIGDVSGKLRRIDFNLVFPLGDPPEYEPAPETSVAAEARRLGVSADDLVYDMLLRDEGRAFLYAPSGNYKEGNLDACRAMIADPNTVIALGDGGAHAGMICDSSIPTFLLTHWSREKGSRPDGFDLTWLVKRQTADTARAVGLHDRGTVTVGKKADLNVIDMDKLSLHAPQMRFDLPAGGKRLVQKADGYLATIVSGAVTYRNGEHTGVLPGRLVRGQQAAAA